ncbi:MAG: restriction endonuclease subunit S [Patescibacteria group bacterium]
MTPNDVKVVAENIDDFIEVPDGVARLRKAVLTLAVSGKLVPQVANEGTAKEFYAQIQTERLKIAMEATRQKKWVGESQEIKEEEVPFVIPSSWKWVRFQETFFSVRGITFPGGDKSKEFEEGYIPVLRSGNVQDTLDLSNLLYVPEKHVRNKNQYLKKGDIVVSMANSRELVGKSCLVGNLEEKYSFGGFLSVFRPYLIFPEYFQMVFSSDFARARFFKDAKQVTNIANLSLATINLIPFPLPPPAEQKRIIKKVEEVMKQLDELEAKKRERDETRSRLALSAMQSLGKGEPRVAFEHLVELVKTTADLKELEGALLTLAVSGRLVPQDKKDGTAEALYYEVQSEMRGRDAGRKKKTKEFEPITVDEIPFDIPKTWKWVRLIEIGKLDTGKTPRTGVTGNYSGDIPFIGPGDVQNGKINSYSKLITKQGAAESKYLHPGDVLMVCIGGTIGKAALVSGIHTFNQQINKITPCLVDSTFLFSAFRSGYFQKLVWSKASGGATPIVNLTRWSSCVVPLPPLAEQKRIVKKVEEVMAFIEKLQARIV